MNQKYTVVYSPSGLNGQELHGLGFFKKLKKLNLKKAIKTVTSVASTLAPIAGNLVLPGVGGKIASKATGILSKVTNIAGKAGKIVGNGTAVGRLVNSQAKQIVDRNIGSLQNKARRIGKTDNRPLGLPQTQQLPAPIAKPITVAKIVAPPVKSLAEKNKINNEKIDRVSEALKKEYTYKTTLI